ncbi:MAG: rod shape-determining protein MreC, partial [bacterium]
MLIIVNPEGLRDSLRRFIIPIEALGGRIKGASSHLNEAIKDNIMLKEENKKLKEEIVLLLDRYAKTEGIIKENKRLRAILSYKEKRGFSIIVANTLGFSPSLFNSTIIIDRGRESGIKKGSCVLSLFKGKEVFLGRVIDVFSSSSLVLLVTDPAFLLPVRLEKTKEKGLLTGLNNKMELKFIEGA